VTAPSLVRDRADAPKKLHLYTIEYTSSAHRGIIMHSEPHAAASAADALAYASSQLPGVAEKYGARGYRVRDEDGFATAMIDAEESRHE
jgi:hypothetical protein